MVGNCDIHRREPADVRHTGVLGIVVREDFRGIGIGERLMHETLRRSQSIGVELVELQVFATNKAALHLHEKAGFRTVWVVPNKMKRGDRCFDEITMFADVRGIDKSTSARRRKG